MKKSLSFALMTLWAAALWAGNKNILPQGGFEEDPNGDGIANGWYVNNLKGELACRLSTEKTEGQYSQELEASAGTRGYLVGGSDWKRCFLPVTGGKSYQLVFEAKRVAGVISYVTLSFMRANSFNELIASVNSQKVESDDWKEYKVVGVAPPEAKFVVVQFLADGEKEWGKIWLDRVGLEELGAMKMGVELGKLEGFDADSDGNGVSDGWHLDVHKGKITPLLSKDCAGKPASQMFDLEEEAVGYFLSGGRVRGVVDDFIPVKPGKSCHVRLKAKCEGKANILINTGWFRDKNWKDSISNSERKAIKNSEWKEHEFIFAHPNEAKFAVLNISVNGKGKIWIDDLIIQNK